MMNERRNKRPAEQMSDVLQSQSQSQSQSTSNLRKKEDPTGCFTYQRLQYPPPGALVGSTIIPRDRSQVREANRYPTPQALEGPFKRRASAYESDYRSREHTPASVFAASSSIPPSEDLLLPAAFPYPPPTTHTGQWTWIHETGRAEDKPARRGSRGGSRTRLPLSNKQVPDPNLTGLSNHSIKGNWKGSTAVAKSVGQLSRPFMTGSQPLSVPSSRVQRTANAKREPLVPQAIPTALHFATEHARSKQSGLFARRSSAVSRYPIPSPINIPTVNSGTYSHGSIVHHHAKPRKNNYEGQMPTPLSATFPVNQRCGSMSNYVENHIPPLEVGASPPSAPMMSYEARFEDQMSISDYPQEQDQDGDSCMSDHRITPGPQAEHSALNQRPSLHGLGFGLPLTRPTPIRWSDNVQDKRHESEEIIDFTPRKPSLASMIHTNSESEGTTQLWYSGLTSSTSQHDGPARNPRENCEIKGLGLSRW